MYASKMKQYGFHKPKCLFFLVKISEHISNIFKEGELDENSVIWNFRTTATDGKESQVEYYNLDVIISVGYRVKLQQVHRKISSRV